MFFNAIYIFTLLVILSLLGTCSSSISSKEKRQIFREQVLPAYGGKIPDDAFRADRLALNRLNSLGIAIPDGVLLEHRHNEKHHNSHRQDPDLESSVIKLVQTPDGRYVPPEGRYSPSSTNQVESTYVIRTPVGVKHHLQPQAPRPGSVTIPTNQLYSQYDTNEAFNDIYSFIRQYDVPQFNFNQPMSQVWSGFGILFPEFLARHLREARGPPPGVHARGPEGGLISDYTLVTNKAHEYPDLQAMPITNFVCDRSGRLYADPETKCQTRTIYKCRSVSSFSGLMYARNIEGKGSAMFVIQLPFQLRGLGRNDRTYSAVVIEAYTLVQLPLTKNSYYPHVDSHYASKFLRILLGHSTIEDRS